MKSKYILVFAFYSSSPFEKNDAFKRIAQPFQRAFPNDRHCKNLINLVLLMHVRLLSLYSSIALVF